MNWLDKHSSEMSAAEIEAQCQQIAAVDGQVEADYRAAIRARVGAIRTGHADCIDGRIDWSDDSQREQVADLLEMTLSFLYTREAGY